MERTLTHSIVIELCNDGFEYDITDDEIKLVIEQYDKGIDDYGNFDIGEIADIIYDVIS